MRANTETGAVSSDTSTAGAGLARLLDRVIELICVMLMLGSVLIACTQVILRYGFHTGLPWAEEIAIWAFCWAIFLGMAMAVGRDSHIAIDTLPNMLSDRNRLRLRFFNRAIIAAASVMFVVHGGVYVSNAI